MLWLNLTSVSEAKIYNVLVSKLLPSHINRVRTMKSSLTLLALPQADMTKASLEAITTTWSTPLAFSLSMLAV